MPTRQENLITTVDQAAARLAELDSESIADRINATYTAPDGHTYDWNGYRNYLMETITRLSTARAGESSPVQQAGGPFTVLG